MDGYLFAILDIPTFLPILPGRARGKRQTGGTLTKQQARIYAKMFVKNVIKMRRILRLTKLCEKFTELEGLMNEGSCEEISSKIREIKTILNDNNLVTKVITTYFFKELLLSNIKALTKSGQLFNFIRKLRAWENIVDCIVPGLDKLEKAGEC